jgi:hypothetical protein
MSDGPRGPIVTLILILILLLLVGSFLSLFATPVLAHDRDNDHHDNKGPEVNVQKGNDGFSLVSKPKSNSSEDRLNFNVDLKDGLGINLLLDHKAGNLETRITYGVRFVCLVGLKEDERSGTVSCDATDKNRTVMLFSKMAFTEPSYSNSTDKGQTVHKFDVSTKDGKFRLQFELTGYFDPNATLQPLPMTMHVKVHCFEYAKNDKYLGLKMKVVSNVFITVKKDLIGHDGTGDDTVETHNPAYNKNEELGSSILALNDKVTVDGGQKDVSSSTYETSDGSMYVSTVYPRSETVQHDMQMEIQPFPIVLKGDLPIYGVAIGATIAVFVLTDKHVLARLARKGK